jgi:hypothetical protein
MKVLFLGNSSEVYGDIPEEDRRASKAAQALEEAFGETVELRTRAIWPNAALPARVEQWVSEFEPDIVYLNVVAFWFNHQSVPLMLERRFGRAGKPLREAGIKASQVPWLGHTRAFHWCRAACQRLIGGATFFEPEQVISVVSNCVRVIVRHEETVLVVSGARGISKYGSGRKGQAWAEERRLRVQGALSALCAELHVEYQGAETARHLTEAPRTRLADRLHSDRDGHARYGAEIADVLKAAWERQRSDGRARLGPVG